MFKSIPDIFNGLNVLTGWNDWKVFNPNLCGQRKTEFTAFAGFAFNPNPTAVALDDLFAERQSDARPRVLLLRVQALEEQENALGILGIDANAVVLDRKDPVLIVMIALRHDNDRSCREIQWQSANREIFTMGGSKC
jgi:hypothetical protein